jgi:hypothetical protein
MNSAWRRTNCAALWLLIQVQECKGFKHVASTDVIECGRLSALTVCTEFMYMFIAFTSIYCTTATRTPDTFS